MKKVIVAISVLIVAAVLCVGAVSAAEAQVSVNCNVNGATVDIYGDNNTKLASGVVSGGVATFPITLPATIKSIVVNADGYQTNTIDGGNYKLEAGERKSFDALLTLKPIGGNVGWISVNVSVYNVNSKNTTPLPNTTVELYDIGGEKVNSSQTDANGNVKFEVTTMGTPVSQVKVIPTAVGAEIKTITVQTPESGQTSTYSVQYTDTSKPATPFPILGILAGLGVAGVLLARRRH